MVLLTLRGLNWQLRISLTEYAYLHTRTLVSSRVAMVPTLSHLKQLGSVFVTNLQLLLRCRQPG
jgi:hypothetical protein